MLFVLVQALLFIRILRPVSTFMWPAFKPLSSIHIDSEATTIFSLLTSEDDPFSFSLSALLMKVGEDDDLRQMVGDRMESLIDDIKSLDSVETVPVVDMSATIQETSNNNDELLTENHNFEKYSNAESNEASARYEYLEKDEEPVVELLNTDNTDTINTSSNYNQRNSDEKQHEDIQTQNNLADETSSIDESFLALRALGYTRGEILSLRESVKRLLLEQNVERSLTAELPREWLKRPVESITVRKKSATRERKQSRNVEEATDNNDNNEDNYDDSNNNNSNSIHKTTMSRNEKMAAAVRGQLSSDDFQQGSKRPRKVFNKNSYNYNNNNNNINKDKKMQGQDVRVSKWHGIQPIDVSLSEGEEYPEAAEEEDDIDDSKYRKPNKNTRNTKRNGDDYQKSNNRNAMLTETDDSYYEPINFWVDRNEFQDLLLAESRWRVNLLGDWIAPAVRMETKWRFALYEQWLQFLEEGSGDLFDVEDRGGGDYEKPETDTNADNDNDEYTSDDTEEEEVRNSGNRVKNNVDNRKRQQQEVYKSNYKNSNNRKFTSDTYNGANNNRVFTDYHNNNNINNNGKKRKPKNIFEQLEQDEAKARLYEAQVEQVRQQAVLALQRRLLPDDIVQQELREEAKEADQRKREAALLFADKEKWFSDDEDNTDISDNDYNKSNNYGDEDDEEEDDEEVLDLDRIWKQRVLGATNNNNNNVKNRRNNNNRGVNSRIDYKVSVSNRNDIDDDIDDEDEDEEYEDNKDEEDDSMAEETLSSSSSAQKKQQWRQRQANLREALFQQQRQQFDTNAKTKNRNYGDNSDDYSQKSNNGNKEEGVFKRLDRQLQALEVDIDDTENYNNDKSNNNNNDRNSVKRRRVDHIARDDRDDF